MRCAGIEIDLPRAGVVQVAEEVLHSFSALKTTVCQLENTVCGRAGGRAIVTHAIEHVRKNGLSPLSIKVRATGTIYSRIHNYILVVVEEMADAELSGSLGDADSVLLGNIEVPRALDPNSIENTIDEPIRTTIVCHCF